MPLGADEDLARIRLVSTPPVDGDVLPRFEGDRHCVTTGCSTRLSIYNGGNHCWLHSRPEPERMIARRGPHAA